MRYLISCDRTADGATLADYVPSRAEAADVIAAVCMMHQLLGGEAVLLTEQASDPELHIDLYIEDQFVGHLSAIPVSDTLN